MCVLTFKGLRLFPTRGAPHTIHYALPHLVVFEQIDIVKQPAGGAARVDAFVGGRATPGLPPRTHGAGAGQSVTRHVHVHAHVHVVVRLRCRTEVPWLRDELESPHAQWQVRLRGVRAVVTLSTAAHAAAQKI